MSKKDRAAVVVGAGLNGLGIVRALGVHGVEVSVVDSNMKRPAMYSRFATRKLVKSLSGGLFVDDLESLLQEYEQPPVLFITEEAPLMEVSRNRDRILDKCEILLPPHEILEKLMSKSGIDKLCEEYGVPHPKTAHITSFEDLAAISEFRFPVMLKPGVKNSEYARRFKKGYKLTSQEEVEREVAEILPVLSNMVVQEWIEGGDRDIYFALLFLSKEAEIISSFAGRKLRSWPQPVGGTASCAPAYEQEAELVSMAAEFLRKSGFVGLGGVEYKRDSGNGVYYLIEPTVSRTDFQHEVAVINGNNMPYHIYCYHCELPYKPKKRGGQHAWVEPVTDRWSREVTGIPDRDLYKGYRKVGALFRWNDPMPWLVGVKNRLAGKVKSFEKLVQQDG